MTQCSDPSCGGSIASDGYCDTCGLATTPAAVPGVPGGTDPAAPASSPISIGAPVAPMSGQVAASGPAGAVIAAGSADGAGSVEGGRAGASRPSRRPPGTSTSTARQGVGAGLLTIAPTPQGDPDQALMTQSEIAAVMGEVPEDDRYCNQCGRPVGRSTGQGPGRVQGFCGSCRTQFDFVTNEPSLEPGDLVAGQYEILGPLAHGGMGWIYLGRDKAVSDRWVVLKGLLNQDDPDAAAAAVAERQFLAQIDHPNIVNIYNFVTHRGAGYIVMEMVGGESLNAKLKRRRADNQGVPNPLPPAEAVAYTLAILPAFQYLHQHDLVYNDLKPANVMAVGSGVKLIDVGAVMRADDSQAAIFGTPGFQAPEIAQHGPSPASDIFTIGRTLAVLMLNFMYHDGPYLYDLPPREQVPVFVEWESLHRFLLKATADHPDDRFADVDTMALQLAGILREMVAITDESPIVAASEFFSPDRLGVLLAEVGGDHSASGTADWRTLPEPKDRTGERSAAFFASLPTDNPTLASEMLETVMERGNQVDAGLLVRYAREQIYLGIDPTAILDQAAAVDPWEWRVAWFRGIWALHLAHAHPDQARLAAASFSRVWTELPGELAPALALAMAAEYATEFERAAQIYQRVFTVDDTYATAAFGRARSLLELGLRTDAIAALQQVPASSVAYPEAQLAVARLLTRPLPGTSVSASELNTAHQIIGRLNVDADQRAELAIEVYQRALASIAAQEIVADQLRLEDTTNPSAGGSGVVDERVLRDHLEAAYRARARLTDDDDRKFRFVDLANQVRVRTLT